MIQIAAVVIAVMGISGFVHYAQWQRNGALKTELSTATEALTDAKAQAETLAAASRGHAAELAAARKRAAGDSVAVRKAIGDCLDHSHGPDIGNVLRGVRAPDGKAKPAASG